MTCHSQLPIRILLTLALFTSINPHAISQAVYQDVTASAGIDMLHTPADGYFITGQAWLDFNRDNCVDVYLTSTVGNNVLYENNCDGTFTISSLSSEVALSNSESAGVSVADYDNDGWPDLLVLNRDGNVLFRNNNGLGFQNVSNSAGLTAIGQAESAAWGDYDNDGWLDLYIVNWFYFESANSPNNSDAFYRNNGDGTFTNVTHLLPGFQPLFGGFAVSFTDFDNDGDQDLYVVNDKEVGNVLWRNDGKGCTSWCFTDVSASSGARRPVDGMGLGIGDYDNDGDMDFHFSSTVEIVLLQNQTSQGSPTFIDVTEDANVFLPVFAWGAEFIDIDNDGWLDLYQCTINSDPTNHRNPLFHNQGDGTFEQLVDSNGAANPNFSIGIAYADYDNDGRLDLMVGSRGDNYKLYRNTGWLGESNNWLKVKLYGGGTTNRSALGTRVTLTLSNGSVQTRELRSGSSIGSGSEPIAHFGLGDNQITDIGIIWPDNTISTPTLPEINATVRYYHPEIETIMTSGFE